jgi:hypothetical protein
MPRARKINLEKVRASLDAVCPKCERLISPAEVRRIDFERIECRFAESDLCRPQGSTGGFERYGLVSSRIVFVSLRPTCSGGFHF